MTSLFFRNPTTKKCGAILELDTLEFASCKKRGCVAVSERHLGKIEHSLCTFRLDQFLEGIHPFDSPGSTNTQHDFPLPADDAFNPEGHWHCLSAEMQDPARMRTYFS